LSLFGGKEGNMFAGKPTISPTPIAKASTAVGEYQPETVPLPSGLQSSSPSVTPTLSPTPRSSASIGLPGATGVIGSTGLPTTPPGLSLGSPSLSKIPGGSAVPGVAGDLKVGTAGATKAKNGLSSGNTTDFTRGSSQGAISPSSRSLDNASIPKGVPVGVGGGGNSGFNVGAAPEADLSTNTELNATRPSRPAANATKPSSTKPNSSKPSKAKSPAAPAAIDDGLPGSVAAGDDLFAPADPKTGNAPVEQLPTDNNINPLETPDSSSAESAQAVETQSHFQKRWKADPNFSETLQYVIRLDKNGKVGRITPQGDISKNYLDKTRFLRPGEKLVSPSRNGKDQDVRVLLKPNGEVETIVEP
jgi:hypothetical protein